jgi:S-adenosylmethionine:tRNA ribosyltransferase-isomerase
MRHAFLPDIISRVPAFFARPWNRPARRRTIPAAAPPGRTANQELPIKTSALQFDLPPDRIAQYPCEPRDAARLMVLDRASGRIAHHIFRDLPGFLRPTDCVVLNTTRVIPARFPLRRGTGGRIDALFVGQPAPGRWSVMLAGAGRLRAGEELHLASRAGGDVASSGLTTGSGPPLPPAPCRFTFLRHIERGLCELRVDPPADPLAVLEQIGSAPLPPYIRRDAAGAPARDPQDRCRYQTVYARQPGAVAAPTAGMHFTDELLNAIRTRGVSIAEVVLHVGLGTFQPIEVDDLADHHMHPERYELTADSAARIARARPAGGRILAVGTTSVRVLETCAGEAGPVAGAGWTDIFIHPPYRFRAVDALVTNFHLPGSSLLALVCAFAGRDGILRAYRCAIEEGYRFYSYGDAMLIV